MKRNNALKIIFIVILLNAQYGFPENRINTLTTDGKALFTNFFTLGKKVLRPEKRALLRAAITVSGITFLTVIDDPTKSMLRKNRSDFFTKLSSIDRYYGERSVTSFTLLGLYTAGIAMDARIMHRPAWQAIQAMLYTSFFNEIIKISAGRKRPYKSSSAWAFEPFSGRESRKSLPSGHVAITFAISGVFAAQNDHPLWKAGWYGSASLVAFARMYRNKHWLSDTALGAFLGYAISRFVLDARLPAVALDLSDHGQARIVFSIVLNPVPGN